MRRLTKPCPLCGGMPETFQGRHIRCSGCGNIQTAGWEHWNQLPGWPVENQDQWTTLAKLRNGAIFETKAGVLALVTEYNTFDDGTQRDCYLLESGEAAHFEDRNDQDVREIEIGAPQPKPAEVWVPEQHAEWPVFDSKPVAPGYVAVEVVARGGKP